MRYKNWLRLYKSIRKYFEDLLLIVILPVLEKRVLKNVVCDLKKVPHNLPGDLVVSLTSYPKRFSTLHLTIKSLMLQNVSFDTIVLWIAEKDKANLPDNVLELQNQGLTIMYCEDMRSYKKLIPSLKVFPNSFIVSCDDDLYYHPNWLSDLTTVFSNNYKIAICSRAHRIFLDQSGKPQAYLKWGYEEGSSLASIFNFPTTGSGVLYPPNFFHPTVVDVETATKLCPDADDVWFYWMMIMNGCTAKKIDKNFRLVEWRNSQNDKLWQANVYSGGNDKAIENMSRIFRIEKNVSGSRNS